ncbi:hypothetical protein CDV31_000034 [Fusarium ambrosium]|uniref:DUF7514 domain-containing protein n=1 Tax=Fusarium ambrosium TaxID=131363 RepID=A0A428V3A0_9HYPO|nr:hypothetical protein CDV31_000034 [Fusarium ambrosium]
MATPPKTDAPPGASSTPPPPPIEYVYMYEKDKSPSKLLDALLRAIVRHIILNIGDKTECHLTPSKLAAFYKAVGGDYDSLFVEMPHESISYIWQVTGCQHTLQPTDDDFEPPSIPALTPRGFSRWESLEILLGPEEHVPFLQFAVKNWHLKHPETGQEFPPDLPKEVFPAQADAEVDHWHKSCAEKLRKEAQVREKEASRGSSREVPRKGPGSGPEPDDTPEPKFAYTHVPGNAFAGQPRRPPEPAYDRPLYNHVPGRHGSGRAGRPSPGRYDSNFDEHARRRSFSDYNNPPPHAEPPYTHGGGGAYLDPNAKRPVPPRRHSQPRHYSSESTDEDEPAPPRMKRRNNPSPPSPGSRRYSPPSGPPPPVANPPTSFRPHRSDIRPDEPIRRRSTANTSSIREKLSEKVSNMLPNGLTGSDRTRNSPRAAAYHTDSQRARRSRDRIPPTRLSRSYSDLSGASSEGESSDEEYHRTRRMRDERERDRDRDRLRERDRGRQRELEREREREDERRERYLRRPDVERRTSSHADADRRRDYPAWDSRNDRKRWDKRIPPEERGGSPGGMGRRYPEAAYP